MTEFNGQLVNYLINLKNDVKIFIKDTIDRRFMLENEHEIVKYICLIKSLIALGQNNHFNASSSKVSMLDKQVERVDTP